MASGEFKGVRHRQPADWGHQVVCTMKRPVGLLNGSAGDFFPTTEGVQQICPLSPVLFNLGLFL